MNTTTIPTAEDILQTKDGYLTMVDPKISWAFLEDIKRYLDDEKTCEKLENFSNKKIFLLSIWTFLAEYESKDIWDTDKKLFRKHFEKDGFFAKKLQWGLQIPESAGSFEYKGKYYMVLRAFNTLGESITDLLSYKWVVLDIQSYVARSLGSDMLSNTTEDRLNRVINNPELKI